MNRTIKRLAATFAPAVVGALAAVAIAIPAAQAITNQLTLPVAYPQGVAMDALNWGGTGTAASCASGTAVVNSYVGVWKSTGAGCASQFRVVPLTIGTTAPGSNGPFELLYAPNGVAAKTDQGGVAGAVTNGFCVSTYANSQGAFARLRHCSATLSFNTVTNSYSAVQPTTANEWQDFMSQNGTVDDSSSLQIKASFSTSTSNLCLNDKAFGGSGSHVISYSCTPYRANEAWNTPNFG